MKAEVASYVNEDRTHVVDVWEEGTHRHSTFYAVCYGRGCDWRTPSSDDYGKVYLQAREHVGMAIHCDYCGWIEPDQHLGTCRPASERV